MAFCEHCGQPVAEDWNYCRSCGEPLEKAEPALRLETEPVVGGSNKSEGPGQPRRRRPRLRNLIALGVAAVVVASSAGAVGFIVSRAHRRPQTGQPLSAPTPS